MECLGASQVAPRISPATPQEQSRRHSVFLRTPPSGPARGDAGTAREKSAVLHFEPQPLSLESLGWIVARHHPENLPLKPELVLR